GVDTVILPKRNEPDLDDLPEDVRNALTFVLVDDVKEVLEAALSPEAVPANDAHFATEMKEQQLA
ncbi:MAG: S16 family serine protease, partial [Aggregatilineales bacterium]